MGRRGESPCPERREIKRWVPVDGRVLTGDGMRGFCRKMGKVAPSLDRTFSLVCWKSRVYVTHCQKKSRRA